MKKFYLVSIFLICVLMVVFPVCAREYADVTEETGIDFTKITDYFPAGISISDSLLNLNYLSESPSDCIFSDGFNDPVPDGYNPQTAKTSKIYDYIIPNVNYNPEDPRSPKTFTYQFPAITCFNKNGNVYFTGKFDVYKTKLEYLHFEVYRAGQWSRADLGSNFRNLANYYRETANILRTDKSDEYELVSFEKDDILIDIIAYYPIDRSGMPTSLTFDMTY